VPAHQGLGEGDQQWCLAYDKKNYLFMYAMGANAGGKIGCVMAAAVMLSIPKGMKII
jgi:Na+-transporting methylmalonyl-CoA/oxaloacetate decarboxylase beta subunit